MYTYIYIYSQLTVTTRRRLGWGSRGLPRSPWKRNNEIFVNQKQVGHENSVGWFLVFSCFKFCSSCPDYIVPYHLFLLKNGRVFLVRGSSQPDTKSAVSPYRGAESDAALDDFKKRVEAYEAQYEPLQARPDPMWMYKYKPSKEKKWRFAGKTNLIFWIGYASTQMVVFPLSC